MHGRRDEVEGNSQGLLNLPSPSSNIIAIDTIVVIILFSILVIALSALTILVISPKGHSEGTLLNLAGESGCPAMWSLSDTVGICRNITFRLRIQIR